MGDDFIPAPGWYPDPSGAPKSRYWDGRRWTPDEPAPTNKTGLVVIASVLIILIGAAVGLYLFEMKDAIPRPEPTPDQQFQARISGIPMRGDEPEIVARSVCLAFKRTPGTKINEAQQTMAAQNGWTLNQAGKFLNAATTRYCPEYRFGS